MLGLRITAGILLAAVAVLAFDTAPKGLVWQSGQIVSLKEEVLNPDDTATSYVYGLRAKDQTFVVVVPAPLKALLHSSVKFAVEKNVVYIQDLDGKLRKGCIVEPADTPPHR